MLNCGVAIVEKLHSFALAAKKFLHLTKLSLQVFELTFALKDGCLSILILLPLPNFLKDFLQFFNQLFDLVCLFLRYQVSEKTVDVVGQIAINGSGEAGNKTLEQFQITEIIFNFESGLV